LEDGARIGAGLALALRWGFRPEEELAGGYCSAVYADASRVLKIPLRGEELHSGFHATLQLAAIGGPAVLEADEPTGVVLMERIRPGDNLMRVADVEAEPVIVGFIERLVGLDTSRCLPLEQSYAGALAEKLHATTVERVFLHGDLHHENVLRAPNGWRVIDPKGLVGDRNFEPIAYLRNPLDWVPIASDLAAVTRARIDRFAAVLGLDRGRITAWGLVDKLDGDRDSRLVDVYTALLEEWAPELVGR
jgi:streptomycin 6-kinase